MSAPAGGVAREGAGRGGPGRRRRRVVALSALDQRRVERGGRPEDLARADYERDALAAAGGHDEGGAAGGAPPGAGSNDRRLLSDVPPHWQ